MWCSKCVTNHVLSCPKANSSLSPFKYVEPDYLLQKTMRDVYSAVTPSVELARPIGERVLDRMNPAQGLAAPMAVQMLRPLNPIR